ncbi:uncharacterized protein LOC123509120 [Portunus trituberculatus]|uniref:uncharacterized protein LOC123509120 n=1 Tax=Portunus trituberculatus TaxID=210409 RepID=UPI001E1CB32A|nr:uncharacterized protein LOC123509120 [Portunus trituberculatus]
MRTFVCVLVVLGAVSAQEATDPSAIVDVNTVAIDAGATATADAGAAAAPATASASASAAAAAGGLANRGTVGLTLGPAFYGPGLQNPTAIAPNKNIVTILQNYLRTSGNTDLRVFVDVDGAMHFTNQFGQETEVLDPTINEFLELGADPFEMQERLTELRQQSLEQAILRCETEMRQRYFTDPASFTPALLKGLNIPAAGGAGGAAAVGVGARAVVA